MNGKTEKVARAGSIMVRINKEFYEVPENALLFKAHNGKDVYLSGIRNDSTRPFQYDWIGTVHFIEEHRFEDVPFRLLEKFMEDPYKKFVIDDEEYDIPIRFIYDCKTRISKFSKYNPNLLKEFKELYKDFLFKSN